MKWWRSIARKWWTEQFLLISHRLLLWMLMCDRMQVSELLWSLVMMMVCYYNGQDVTSSSSQLIPQHWLVRGCSDALRWLLKSKSPQKCYLTSAPQSELLKPVISTLIYQMSQAITSSDSAGWKPINLALILNIKYKYSVVGSKLNTDCSMFWCWITFLWRFEIMWKYCSVMTRLKYHMRHGRITVSISVFKLWNICMTRLLSFTWFPVEFCVKYYLMISS